MKEIKREELEKINGGRRWWNGTGNRLIWTEAHQDWYERNKRGEYTYNIKDKTYV